MFEIPGPSLKREEQEEEEEEEKREVKKEEKTEEKPVTKTVVKVVRVGHLDKKEEKKEKKPKKKRKVPRRIKISTPETSSILSKIKTEIRMFRDMEIRFERELSTDVIKKLSQTNQQIEFYSRQKSSAEEKLVTLEALQETLLDRKRKILKETDAIKKKISILEKSFEKVA